MLDPKFATNLESGVYTIKVTDGGAQLTLMLSEREARELLREMAGDFDYDLCSGYCHEFCGSSE